MPESRSVGQTESARLKLAHLRAFSQILGDNPLLFPHQEGDASGPEYNIHVAFCRRFEKCLPGRIKVLFPTSAYVVFQSPSRFLLSFDHVSGSLESSERRNAGTRAETRGGLEIIRRCDSTAQRSEE